MLGCDGLETTGVARMMDIGLGLELVPGQADFVRVDNDDMIAGVNMRGEGRFMFSPQQDRNPGSQPS